MRVFLSATLLLATTFAACDNVNKAPKGERIKTTEQKRKAAPASMLSPGSQTALLDMMTPYYELKEALVATSASKADAAASRLLSATENARHQIMTADAGQKGTIDSLTLVMKATEDLINVKDETCEKKRAAFEHISDGIFAAASSVNLKNAGIYREYCPMAFNNKGAYWLSEVDTIRNPYFGKRMLECGEVRDSL